MKLILLVILFSLSCSLFIKDRKFDFNTKSNGERRNVEGFTYRFIHGDLCLKYDPKLIYKLQKYPYTILQEYPSTMLTLTSKQITIQTKQNITTKLQLYYSLSRWAMNIDRGHLGQQWKKMRCWESFSKNICDVVSE